jgi:NADH:ubiquinone reductase (H+-translocating)
MSSSSRPHVVIVGGGFGGLQCAKKLAGEPVDVTLIDARDYHLFTPLLYQVATALLNPADIAYPFRSILRRARNVRFHQAMVAGIDFEQKLIRTGNAHELSYDYLVLATGSVNDYFGNSKLAETTLGMKNLEQAQRLRNHVLACLEHAAQTTDDAEQSAWLTFVVVGGGATGVEYAGALAELRKLVGREYPEFSALRMRVVVVEGADRLLPAFPEKLGRYAQKVLERKGAEITLGTVMADAGPMGATLSNGSELAARTIVWSAGVRAAATGGTQELEHRRSYRLAVDDSMVVVDKEGVWAIGDVAGAEHTLPMLSSPAMQQGRYVARAILGAVRGQAPPPPFQYKDKGTMAVIGRGAAVANVRGLQLTGFIGWLAWLAVHLYYVVGFRNRVAVFFHWGWDYVRRDRPTRMITTVEPDAVADALSAVKSS